MTRQIFFDKSEYQEQLTAWYVKEKFLNTVTEFARCWPNKYVRTVAVEFGASAQRGARTNDPRLRVSCSTDWASRASGCNTTQQRNDSSRYECVTNFQNIHLFPQKKTLEKPCRVWVSNSGPLYNEINALPTGLTGRARPILFLNWKSKMWCLKSF